MSSRVSLGMACSSWVAGPAAAGSGRDEPAPDAVRGRSDRGRSRVRRVAGDVLEALGEAAGVALLGAGQRLEPLGDLLEALVAGGLGEARVHLGVLVGLAGDGRLEVVRGARRPARRWRGRRPRRGSRSGRTRGRSRPRRPSGTARRRRGSPRRRPSGRSRGSGGWPGSRRRTPPSGSRGSWLPSSVRHVRWPPVVGIWIGCGMGRSADGQSVRARRRSGRSGPGRRSRCRATAKPCVGGGAAEVGAKSTCDVDARRRSASQTRWWWASRLGSKRVEPVPRSSGADLAHRGQVVERLVHGAERDGGHLGPHRVVDRLGRRVRSVAVRARGRSPGAAA